jgi:hypothetical protein
MQAFVKFCRSNTAGNNKYKSKYYSLRNPEYCIPEILTTMQFRDFLSSCLLHKKVKIKIHETTISYYLLFCMGIEVRPLPKEEHRLKVLENMVLRRIFGPKKEVTGGLR